MNAVELIFRLVVDGSWRMACLILLFLALRPLLRGRVSARVVFWVWIAVAIRLLLPVAVPVNWSPFNLTRLAYPDSRLGEFEMSAAEPGRSTKSALLLTQSAPVTYPRGRPAHVATLSPIQWAASVWVLGVAVILVGRVRSYCRFVRRLRNSHKAIDSLDAAIVAETAAGVGVSGVQIIVTDAVGTPALHGLFRPTLLFPPGLMEKLSQDEIELIVAHEMGHHKRRDLLAQATISAAQTLHWFNPLIWIAARSARHDCELACDEYVVRRLGPTGPQIYGATLLKIIGMASQIPQAPLGLGIVEPKQQIKRRIQMILASRPSFLPRTVFGCALFALVAGLCLTRETRAEQQPAATGPAVTTEAPSGWWKNGTNNAVAYVAGVDRNNTHDALPSAYVKSVAPVVEGFGGMMQMCAAENFLGKRLRFSAWMKTENTNDGGAHLWFRVDGKETNSMLQFDNMDSRPVKGTTDWQQYAIVLDVPANAAALAYGFFVGGTGQAWVSGVKIEEVGADVPSTNMTRTKPSILPNSPVNLGFEGAEQPRVPASAASRP
jgi:beta-lactamase regulating signal transducer with metallopeptidase domain